MTDLAVLLLAFSLATDGPKLTNLSAEAPELKQAMNAAKGSVRMLLIVSPG